MPSLNLLFNQAATSAPLRTSLQTLLRPRFSGFVELTGAIESAQAFLVGLMAEKLSPSGRARLWVVCKNQRRQESFYQQLRNWWPEALWFPDLEISVAEGAVPDPDNQAERLETMERLGEEKSFRAIVIHQASWEQSVPDPQAIAKEAKLLQVGDRFVIEEFLPQLIGHGYTLVPQVNERGQVAIRGGIIDIFSWQGMLPFRLELFGEEIASLREFDLHDQVSLRTLNQVKLLYSLPTNATSTLRSHVGKEDIVLTIHDSASSTPFTIHEKVLGVDLDALGFFSLDFPRLRTEAMEAGLADTFTRQVTKRFLEWNRDGWKLVIFFQHDSERIRIQNYLSGITAKPFDLFFQQGFLQAGFQLQGAKIAALTSREIFGHAQAPAYTASRANSHEAVFAAKRTQIDFSELIDGELVVHLNYGLARFLGIHKAVSIDGEQTQEDVLALEFAEGAKLFVPLSQSFLVSRYVALGKKGTTLSRLGDNRWSAAKKSAEKSVYDFAAKLIKLQAQREALVGHAFEPDTPWQSDFENTFPYIETTDQIRAIAEVKTDMESSRPMDRLICGDVGFGKTEVAIRAAFKAVMGGKQVAMLVPTTVLAQQHYENFALRMQLFPVALGVLSRFRTEAEQHKTVQGLRDGSVDLVIGTHRLISKDVIFKNLGLLIVDEEQRFGVLHKERIKNHYPLVDVLTLSATPIPRTLYLSLVGTRDLSTLDTPPPNRFAVETVVCPYDERIIRDAIHRELHRQGQVYFLHNRVQSIERVRDRLFQLCPNARIDLGHGQMDEGELEEVMHRFVSGQTDVLVATTIIESGLDIPNANTIVIDRADRFGLADLYQLRGRVGRGAHKAYAFLMLPRELMMAPESRKRLSAIRQYSALGAGFKIALRDLEIRGAGNILGVAQSGHITAIGFDLYCQLLRQAVSHLKGEKVRGRLEVILRLDFVADSESSSALAINAPRKEPATKGKEPFTDALLPAFLPSAYIQDSRLRVQAYRQLAEISHDGELKKLQEAWRDRFGPLLAPVENLLALTHLKLAAAEKRVSLVEARGEKLMLTRKGDFVLQRGRFPRLTSAKPEIKLREIFLRLQQLPE